MAQQKVPNQWQLQDTGESGEQWMLSEEEQRLPSHMQLREDLDTGPALADTNWQPIDYQAMQAATQRPRRGGVALGSLLVIALVAVGGYLAWNYAGMPGLPDQGARGEEVALDPVETPLAGVPLNNALAVTATTPLTMEAAAPTPPAAEVAVPPTPLPSPTLPALVEVRQGTVTQQYGVNLRNQASSTGTLIEVLENGTTHLVLSGPVNDAAGGAWYELATTDGKRGWASGDFLSVASQQLAYDQAAALYTAAGAEMPAPAAAPAADPAAPAASEPVDASTQPTVALSLPTPTAAAVVRLTGVISAPAGLNLRSEAQTGDNVLQMLADQTPVTVIGRSQDGTWAQVELAGGVRGWISADFVTVTGDINTIALGTTQPLTPTETTQAAASAATATPAAAPAPPAGATQPVTGVASATGVGTLTVTSVLGVNVRPQPLSDSTPIAQLNWNDTARASGRTADNGWIQVQLPDGRTGWVAAGAVNVAEGLASLPVVP